jgi:RNA polymerase sigma-70 factor (ECF subfamily)
MERDELRLFVERDYARVVAALGWACGDRVAAEDAVQDVLATEWLRSNHVHNVPAWVTRAALNRLRSTARRRGAEARAVERLGQASMLLVEVPAPFDPLLAEELHRLPPRQREIVVLHYLLDMSVADISDTLGITDGTVKTQLHRARSSLRARLSSGDPSEEEVNHVD